MGMLNSGINRGLQIALLLLIFFRGSAQQPDWNQYPDMDQRLAAIRKYGMDLIKKQQYDQAVTVFSTGLQISRKASMDSFTAANLTLLGTTHRYKAQYDSAFYFYAQAEKIATEKKYISIRAFIQIESYAIFNRTGKSDSAAAAISRMKEILPQLDSNSSESAKIEMYLGHDDKHKAKYADALAHYYRSLRIANYLKDSVNQGNIYISLANVLVLLGQQDKALFFHRQAAELFIFLGRRFELVNEYLNIADLYITSNQPDSAEGYVRKALVIIEEMKNSTYLPNAYVDLGYIYARRKQLMEARDYFNQAIKFSQAVNNDISLMDAYQGVGEMYMADHKPSAAADYLDKHLRLAKQENNKEEIIEALADLAENENALHHYEKAYEYQKLFNVYKDSAYTESTEQSTTEMESKYEAEKKEQEIALLKKDQLLNRLNLEKQKDFQWGAIVFLALLLIIGFLMINRYRVIQRTRRLIDMERMRNTIARDLHDDIGSTISSINILSKVALQQHAQGDLPMGTSIQKIKDRSESIMESMSDIVWAINPHHDTIEQMIFRMKEFAGEILEPLNIKYRFNEEGHFLNVKMDVEKRKDFYLLFKEAVNNAAKYSGCRNVYIGLKQEARLLRLLIEDDGKGFDTGEIKNGNGLVNMRRRADSMKGVIQIDSASGKGTRISVEVPLT
jgi:two-component system, NarL family, sensor histidine kinase UhpB